MSTDDLRQAWAEVEGKKPTQQVMAAINYLKEDEATLEDVAERYEYAAGSHSDLNDSNCSPMSAMRSESYLCITRREALYT